MCMQAPGDRMKMEFDEMDETLRAYVISNNIQEVQKSYTNNYFEKKKQSRISQSQLSRLNLIEFNINLSKLAPIQYRINEIRYTFVYI